MSYVKTVWANGDIITASKLNNMENGIEAISNIPTLDITETDENCSVDATALASVLAKLPHAILIRKLYNGEVDNTYITTFGGVDVNSTAIYFVIENVDNEYSVFPDILYQIVGEAPESCTICGVQATLTNGAYVWSAG